MNYAETVEYLYAYLPMYQNIGSDALKKDLTNTILLLEYLNNPQQGFKSIHIAGTNGKGSSAHTLAAILQSSGYKTGLYTSPHLKNFTERIKINGNEIPQEAVVAFVEKIKPAIEKIKPSFFEVTVAMAFQYFDKEKVDIAIIETGLGGRLDSTNIIQPQVSLITNIDYDHQAILGNTLEEIAGEKAGIIKRGIPAIVGEYQSEVADIFTSKASSVNAPLSFASKEYEIIPQISSLNAENLVVDVYAKGLLSLEKLVLSLQGMYQCKNIPGILKTVDFLIELGYKISPKEIRKGFLKVKSLTGLKGRWQILQNDPLIICDTAHNEAGLRLIIQQLSKLTYKQLHIVFGVANDKSLRGVFDLLPQDAHYYFCQANIPRALNAEVLAANAKEYGLVGAIIPDVNEAIEKAKACAGPDDVIFIGGSNFVVAEIETL